MRERVEDLGVLSEMLRSLVEHKLFQQIEVSPSRFIEEVQDSDEAERLFHLIENVERMLQECYQIARWGDMKDL